MTVTYCDHSNVLNYKRMTLMIYNILNQDFDREVFCRKLGKGSEAAKPGFAWNVPGHWAYK